MCYTVKYLKEKALKRAIHYGIKEDIEHYREELRRSKDAEMISGFAHPELIIYTNNHPTKPRLSTWGLIPNWIKTKEQADSIKNKTLNARSETIFEKPSFKLSAKSYRCIIPLAGFYEYHHTKSKKEPYLISHINDEPLYMAGLWSKWTNKQTGEIINSCSIITTKANKLMSHIHNNPKLSEPRMPLILNEMQLDEWLLLNNKHKLQVLQTPYPDERLKAKKL